MPVLPGWKVPRHHGSWPAPLPMPHPCGHAVRAAVSQPAPPPPLPHAVPRPQVVAGANYQVVADLTCNDIASSVGVEAIVYVPLPVYNEDPQVTEVRRPCTLVGGKAPAQHGQRAPRGPWGGESPHTLCPLRAEPPCRSLAPPLTQLTILSVDGKPVL